MSRRHLELWRRNTNRLGPSAKAESAVLETRCIVCAILLPATSAQHVAIAGETLEDRIDRRMRDRAVLRIRHEILFRNISLVRPALRVLRKQMIEGLVLRRPPLGGNRVVPFLSIVEDRIDVEDHAAKRIEAVP